MNNLENKKETVNEPVHYGGVFNIDGDDLRDYMKKKWENGAR
jgi:hypothetical protein